MPMLIACKLRKNPTDAEKHLWFRLRYKQLDGFRFSRQQPIGSYVVDFFCPEAALIIELDGGQHVAAAAQDAVRTAWLEKRGYRVIRFWNNDVLGNTEGVLLTIREVLRGGPPTLPPPQGGR